MKRTKRTLTFKDKKGKEQSVFEDFSHTQDNVVKFDEAHLVKKAEKKFGKGSCPPESRIELRDETYEKSK